MNTADWQKQTTEPLYPDILWSRPEAKHGAGKLAIIGGNAHAFGAPGIAWNTANDSGIGVVKVLLPDAVKKTVKYMLPEADYAPSNPSGSFSKQSLADLLELANWSDATILSGDFGRNSETAVLLEDFVAKYSGLLTVTQDAVDYFKSTPKQLFTRDKTMVVLSLAQLQKIFVNTPVITPITYSMTELQLAEALYGFTKEFKATIIVKHNATLFVASNGSIASQSPHDDKVWRVKTAARATVFWLQNPEKPLQAAVSSMATMPSDTV